MQICSLPSTLSTLSLAPTLPTSPIPPHPFPQPNPRRAQSCDWTMGPWDQELGRRRSKGRKRQRGWGRVREEAVFISMPRAGSLHTMDTARYSKWSGGLEEVSGGMSNGTASLAPLGPCPASGLGFDGGKEGNSQERGQIMGAGETLQSLEPTVQLIQISTLPLKGCVTIEVT